jgi:ATP adenylyltransferase
MVAPYRHVGQLEALSSEEMAELWLHVRSCVQALKRLLKPDGFNVGMNIGRVSGAGFPGHLHVHIVPRWNGDTNFMPVLSETKVISQSLEELYRLLVAELSRS